MFIKKSVYLPIVYLPIVCLSVYLPPYLYGFPGGSVVKKPPANAGYASLIPGLGRSPGVGNSNPFSILVWKITWTEEPGGLQSMGLQRVTKVVSN